MIEKGLADIQFPRFQKNIKLCSEYDEPADGNFCVLDEEGVYVDLIKNPEGFTGYRGKNAERVWNAIYDANCFESGNPSLEPSWGTCMERKLFYKVISGLHSSISTHIATRYLCERRKKWVVEKPQFMNRVAHSQDRIANLLSLYLQMAKAVRFVLPKLFDYDFLAESKAEAEISRLSMLSVYSNLKGLIRTKPVFLKNTRKEIISEFRQRFMKVSTIMDCITCEKCRLWGKIQTLGVGTSFKVLFALESKNRWSKIRLKNPEIIALLNTFARISESVKALTYFREAHARDCSCLQMLALVILVLFLQ